MCSIKYDFEKQKFVYIPNQRSDFSKETKDEFKDDRESNQDICHRVSYKVMACALVNAANYYLSKSSKLESEDPDSQNQLQDIIGYSLWGVDGIIRAVTGLIPEPNEEGGDLGDYEQNIYDLELSFESIFKENKENNKEENEEENGEENKEKIPVGIQEVENNLNDILDKLNNERFNLQLGDSSKNRSIGSAFDCFGEVSYDDEDGTFTLGETDSKVLSYVIHKTFGGGDDFDESEVFIYTTLTDEGDPILCRSSGTDEFPEDREETPDCVVRFKDEYGDGEKDEDGYTVLDNASVPALPPKKDERMNTDEIDEPAGEYFDTMSEGEVNDFGSEQNYTAGASRQPISFVDDLFDEENSPRRFGLTERRVPVRKEREIPGLGNW